MRRIDDLSPLGDDNFALGHETPRSGPCLVHQSLPSGWVKQSSGFRRANSFPGAALREQFHDGGFEGLVEIIHYTSPLLEKHSQVKASTQRSLEYAPRGRDDKGKGGASLIVGC
jgi:hypothetical protein